MKLVHFYEFHFCCKNLLYLCKYTYILFLLDKTRKTQNGTCFSHFPESLNFENRASIYGKQNLCEQTIGLTTGSLYSTLKTKIPDEKS